jgi:cell division septation protein DedD
VLFAAALFGVGYAYQQNLAIADLTMQNQSLHSTVEQMRTQIASMTDRINQLATAAPTPAVPAAAPAGTGQTGAKRASANASSAQDRRIRPLQMKLDDQQKQLKEAQDLIASTKTDFEGRLGSTREELNGSIAKTHEQLVALEKLGERSYYEFDLRKAKSFQREGPIGVSLRKADPKHQSYDLVMLVDDHELWKRKVDLYEPIWLHQSGLLQPVQVVVNEINKDHIHGYVSAPRCRESELTSSNNVQPTSISTSSSASAPSLPSPSRQTTPTATTSPSSTSATPPQQTSAY